MLKSADLHETILTPVICHKHVRYHDGVTLYFSMKFPSVAPKKTRNGHFSIYQQISAHSEVKTTKKKKKEEEKKEQLLKSNTFLYCVNNKNVAKNTFCKYWLRYQILWLPWETDYMKLFCLLLNGLCSCWVLDAWRRYKLTLSQCLRQKSK